MIIIILHDQRVAQQEDLLQVEEVVAKSRARVYFEQQTLALLLVFHQTHYLVTHPHQRKSTNQRAAFLQPQQMFMLRDKVKNAKHRPKTCNETMLRDKLSLRAFVSPILLPYRRNHMKLCFQIPPVR